MGNTIKMLVNVNELRYLDIILRENFPYIHMFLPDGLNSIIDCLMVSYQLTDHDQGTFIEETMSVIDVCISEYSEVYGVKGTHVDLAYTELYSHEFCWYMNNLYNSINNHLNNLLSVNYFIVSKHDSFDRLTKIFIEVKVNV